MDINTNFAAPFVVQLDAGDPIVVLSGIHIGCFELFAAKSVRAIRDLKGKTVSLYERGSSQEIFLASMIAYVGLDPRKDVSWVVQRGC